MRRCSSSLPIRAAIIHFLILIAVSTYAATLPFKNFTTADGLASDRVNRIYRDSSGFLWFCTTEGLARFDGFEFRTFGKADGLPHQGVNAILEMDTRLFLVGTDDGLVVFDPDHRSGASDLFRKLRLGEADRSIVVSGIDRTPSGTVYVSTFRGLFRAVVSGLDLRFERVESDVWSAKDIEFARTAEDHRGNLWIATSLGLFLRSAADGTVRLFSKMSVTNILEDRERRIWVSSGSDRPGLAYYSYPDGSDLPVLQRAFTTADGLTDDIWIHAILETKDGRIIAGIRNGLCEYVPDAPAGQPLFRRLFDVGVVSVEEDIAGNIWIGTAAQGAFKITRGSFTFFEIPEKKPFVAVTSLFAGRDGEMFVTSSNSDLLRFDGEKFVGFEPAGVRFRTWGSNQLDLRSAVDGQWWVPTNFGLLRYAAVRRFEDLRRTPPIRVYGKPDGLAAEDIFRLFEDSRGDLWFSTISIAALMRLDRGTERIVAYGPDLGLPADSSVTAIAEDAAGRIWLGFYSGGIGRLANGNFEMFRAPDRFPPGIVNSIHRDRKGRLWVATGNSGIIRIDDPTAVAPAFDNLTTADGLSSDLANCVTEDRFGRIYVGTARGINRIDPDTGRVKIYTHADGLPGARISRCASDSNGDPWFAHRFTIARLSAEPGTKTPIPPIYISDVKVNGERIPEISELGQSSVTGLSFGTDQRQIQIDFFALSFGTAETIRYRYRFGNEQWSAPIAQRTITLNLAPGSYDFQVQAVTADGEKSETPATVSFSIARPVWQRWWFLMLVAIVVGLAAYSIYRSRLRRLVELERVRTRIATDLHDDIGSSLSQIAIMSEVVRQQVGDNVASEPLDVIAETSREMVDSMSDIVWAINPAKDSLHDLVNRMRRFAGDVLEAKGIELRFGAPDSDVTLGADIRREIYLIFKEAVNNVAKHSGASQSDISVEVEDRSMNIGVADNGCGMKDDGDRIDFGGNGIANMRRRTEALGGSFSITSAPGEGSSVRISVPLEKRVRARRDGRV